MSISGAQLAAHPDKGWSGCHDSQRRAEQREFRGRQVLQQRLRFLQPLHSDDRERFVEVARRGVREKADYNNECRIIFPEKPSNISNWLLTLNSPQMENLSRLSAQSSM